MAIADPPASVADSGAAVLAQQRLYRPPALPPESADIRVDNVYAMQILALPNAAGLAEIGRRAFFDPSLSASGKMSCATCHDPDHAYAPANAESVQRGGARLDQMGSRAVPSLRYKQRLPAFAEHFFDEDVPTGVDQGPTGGYGWDGHFSTAHIQAGLPLLAPHEMANAGPAVVAAHLKRGSYADLFTATLGPHAFDNDVITFKWLTLALEFYQRDAAQFFPYSSKFDAVLEGKAQFTALEKQGLTVFEDPEKGNCASCHTSRRGRNGAHPDFTDYGLVALGVPRNAQLDQNRDPRFYDMGLCGPFRDDMKKNSRYCGLFRTPSLRNVATRHSFFHNGVMHELKDVLAFYATRDQDAAHWYPRAGGAAHGKHIDRYNDLPPAFRKNVHQGAPFSAAKNGQRRLGQSDLLALEAFLQTLNDGYSAR